MFVSELHQKQLLGSRARFIDNGEIVIDAFQHLEKITYKALKIQD